MMAQPTVAVPVEDLEEIVRMATTLSLAAADLLIDAGHGPAPRQEAEPARGLPSNVVALADYRRRRELAVAR